MQGRRGRGENDAGQTREDHLRFGLAAGFAADLGADLRAAEVLAAGFLAAALPLTPFFGEGLLAATFFAAVFVRAGGAVLSATAAFAGAVLAGAAFFAGAAGECVAGAFAAGSGDFGDAFAGVDLAADDLVVAGGGGGAGAAGGGAAAAAAAVAACCAAVSILVTVRAGEGASPAASAAWRSECRTTRSISSSGAGLPVQISNCRAPCCTNISTPVMTAMPFCRARRRSGVSSGL